MKLWLLDADVIIKFLEIDVFDKLAGLHELHVASTVSEEVKFYRSNGKKVSVNFKQQYVDTGLVIESSASLDEIQNILKCLPLLKREAIHMGEIESLSILTREESLTFCTFDAAAIRTLPFIGVSDRAISAEKLLTVSGLMLSSGNKLDIRLSESYFRSNRKKEKEISSIHLVKNDGELKQHENHYRKLEHKKLLYDNQTN